MTDDLDPKYARAQGVEARKLTDDKDSPQAFTPADCPYGPGEYQDAWMEGFGAPKTEVRQADTSEPSSASPRHETPKTVRKGGKGGRKRAGGGKGKTVTQGAASTTGTTGNAETALKTETGPANPQTSAEPNVTTTLGDPAATEGDRTAIGGGDQAVDKEILM